MKPSICFDPRGISRRFVLRTMAAASSAPMMVLSGNVAEAKTSHAAAAYQSSPIGDRSCSKCAYFLPPTGCKLVEGPVSSNGACKLWAIKAG